MTIPFHKYQGTGNDFVMIDQRTTQYLKKTDTAIIRQLCDRRFGIGADGLMFLAKKEGFDFEMIYFNADGSESSMCGNGGRCLTAFAHYLGVFKEKCRFLAIDGAHDAIVKGDYKNKNLGNAVWVELKMIDVKDVEIGKDYYLMNTGSPHYVVFVEDLTDIDVYENGRAIRYSERFFTEGVNVNFVEIKKGEGIEVATYERGVEAETYSCGTGVTAAAIAYHLRTGAKTAVPITTKGGNLAVHFQEKKASNGGNTEGVFSEVWLCGPATQVFESRINIR